jgi:hypothetical protein
VSFSLRRSWTSAISIFASARVPIKSASLSFTSAFSSERSVYFRSLAISDADLMEVRTAEIVEMSISPLPL